MKATEIQLLDFIHNSKQFIIPIYQRAYSWTDKQCQQLLDDVIEVGDSHELETHFVGAIVYIEDKPQIAFRTHLVIDGQQRLTTVTLLLAALAQAWAEDEASIEGFSEPEIRSSYLINAHKKDERQYKLLLGETDRDTLTAIVSGRPLPQSPSLRIKENFNFFKEQIGKYKQKYGSMARICKGLVKLMVVDIALARGEDKPQVIFESMNSTGLALSQTDLIRNFVLMDLNHDSQTKIYKDYWRPMETAFGQKNEKHFDAFMRHYLTCKNKKGDIPNKGKVYEEFKSHAPGKKSAGEVEDLVKDIKTYSEHYCAIALDREEDCDIKAALGDLRELKVEVYYPLLLEFYDDYKKDILDKSSLIETIRIIESYVFRRAVCGFPTNRLNKMFAVFKNRLDKKRYLESIKAHFLGLEKYLQFPKDEDFKNHIKTCDLYASNSRTYCLFRFENLNRKEKVSVGQYTIEHIMPQELTEAWKEELGAEWQKTHETMLHTLGNLTLTGYNSEYGNKTFQEKQNMDGGFKCSPLKLNQGLGDVEKWDANAIYKRADELAEVALKIWPVPSLPVEIMGSYKPKSKAKSSIKDYIHSPATMKLFNVLQDEIMALDASVTEDFLKQYIAYRADRIFVSVEPQQKKLNIFLSMPIEDIDNSQGLCRDVSGIGHWGVGDTEVRFDNISQLPYIIGLIRQSLDAQLDNE